MNGIVGIYVFNRFTNIDLNKNYWSGQPFVDV